MSDTSRTGVKPTSTPSIQHDGPPIAPITDKKGFGRRWLFSQRHVDFLLSQGLPHLKVGKRRVRIVVEEGDRWMVEKYGLQRRGPLHAKEEATA